MKKMFVLMAGLLLTVAANAVTVTVDDYEEGATEITVTEMKMNPITGTMTLEPTGALLCKGALKVTITRSEEGIVDQLCIGNCHNGNGEKNEVMEFPVNGMSDWYAHYEATEKKVVTIVYDFEDSEGHFVLTVHYDTSAMALDNVSAERNASGVYSIFGQKLRDDNNTVGLPAGMYVVNGKKQIVK